MSRWKHADVDKVGLDDVHFEVHWRAFDGEAVIAEEDIVFLFVGTGTLFRQLVLIDEIILVDDGLTFARTRPMNITAHLVAV